jgi:AcrR family transcriptional regulator
MKRRSGWRRDPEGMRKRILDAATAAFARYGYGGARIDRIAKAAGANKRMIYYHVGKKDVLYLAILEGVYEHIRAAERRLNLQSLAPVEAITQLITFSCSIISTTRNSSGSSITRICIVRGISSGRER